MEQNKEKLKEYAGGWMTEREGTPIPGFLKLAFAGIGLFCASYLVVYMNGEIGHEDRGKLVQAFNGSTGTADGFMYGVAVVAFIYVGLLIKFALGKPHGE